MTHTPGHHHRCVLPGDLRVRHFVYSFNSPSNILMPQDAMSALRWLWKWWTNENFAISYAVISSPILQTSLGLLGHPWLGQDHPTLSFWSLQVLPLMFTLLLSPLSACQIMSQVSMECKKNVFVASQCGDSDQLDVTPFWSRAQVLPWCWDSWWPAFTSYSQSTIKEIVTTKPNLYKA